jgi:hypothetical protein
VKLSIEPWQVPVRLMSGVFVLHSGLTKRDADEQTAQFVHGFAAVAYPLLKQVDPTTFTRLLSASEIALGVALLAPVVPAGLAGAGLTAFSLGLVGLYLRTPGMRQPGSLRPTQEGTSLAKDAWLLGIGLSLVVDECTKRVRE